jgi:hypothetical protein
MHHSMHTRGRPVEDDKKLANWQLVLLFFGGLILFISIIVGTYLTVSYLNVH